MQGIGRKLKNLRGKRFTQKEVSKATGIPISTIAAYENNLRQPALNNLRTLAEFYGVSPGYLLENNEPNSGISPELWEIYHEVSYRPNLKLLFKEGTKLSEEEITLICQLIRTIKSNR